ncbi:MAG: hypothetical protein CMJ18_03935 [Phycisphaeraceae bacterium]|nr:hypothetical protein [Phycisphaeraceae bacterium]
MIEAVISILLVGVMLVAALRTTGAAARGRLVEDETRRAADLARQMISEVIQNHFEEPEVGGFGRESGETSGDRSNWDDVDDYYNVIENTLVTKDGTEVPNTAGWRRTTQVAYIDPASFEASGSDTGIKRITVIVQAPSGKSVRVDSLRGRVSSYAQPPTMDTTYLSGLNVELQIGDRASTRIASGVSLLNSVPLP